MESKRSTRRIVGLIVFCASLATASAALAQGTPEERSACQGDAFQFCAGDIPNVPAIEGCLKTNISQISPACRAEFEPEAKSRLRAEHFQ